VPISVFPPYKLLSKPAIPHTTINLHTTTATQSAFTESAQNADTPSMRRSSRIPSRAGAYSTKGKGFASTSPATHDIKVLSVA